MTQPDLSSKRGACKYGHTHAEAFMLMKYASEDGTVEEIIWNSRDGVTPFVVTAQDGVTSMTHVDWGRDVYQPDHRPKPGDRIFVDLTPERARASARRNAAHYWETYPPSRESHNTVEDLAAVLEKGYLEAGPGTPDLITVEG